MNDPEQSIRSAEDRVSAEIAERVRSVISAAESAASAIRHEAEDEVQARRRAAEAQRSRYLEEARAEAEELLATRIGRISELSAAIVEGAETLLLQIETAESTKRQLEGFLQSLGQTAEALAAERAEVAAPAALEPAPSVQAGEDAQSSDEPATPPFETPATPNHSDEEGLGQAPSAEAVDRAAIALDEGSESNLTGNSDDDLLSARLVALQMAVAGGSRGEVESHLRRAFECPDPFPILDDVFGQGTDSQARVATRLA